MTTEQLDAREMTAGMSIERAGLARFLPLAGVVAVALWVAGYLLMQSVRAGGGATAEAILTFYQEHGETVVGVVYLTMYGSLFFLVFVASLWNRLRQGEGSGGPLAPLAFAAGIVTAIGQLVIYGSDLAAAVGSEHYSLSASTAEAYYYFGDVWFLGATRTAALMLVATGLVGLRSGILPHWLGWPNLVLAVLLLTPPTRLLLFFAFWAWIVIVALFLAWRATAPARAT